MNRLSRRSLLQLSACQQIQAPSPAEAPIPEARVLAPLPLVERTITYLMNSARVPRLGVVHGGEVVYAKGGGVLTVPVVVP